ncbi:CsgG/HfaB family protein [Novosphingobium sp.]|uniref:CsgG/HfaB family protein n=1 Tax=Novosphingobium sp. TaxID=1874826 RepID=UPI00286DDEBE|nr:CsgG/HfaB family protein [Novosphingobium sp.]
MKKILCSLAAIAVAIGGISTSASGADKGSSARQKQTKGVQEIPTCGRNLGALAIVEPDTQWWRELNVGSPEAILKIFAQKSGCFTMVNRGRTMASRAMERAMADSGELQDGSNLGKGQVKTADYYLEPNIVSANKKSSGGGFGGVLGGVGGSMGGMFGKMAGGLIGGISVKKGEANVTLSVVNARTTEEFSVEGYARKSDIGFGGGGGGLFSGGTFAGAAGGGYQNTEIGQIIVLAYLDAYTKLVGQLGGLPDSAAAAAPQAK